MDFFETLKQKMGPFPVYVWAGLFTTLLAVYLIHKKNSSANNSTTAAANQANSNLGSAAELANMFEVAGLMPYQGGDVYVNTTQNNNPPTPVNGNPPDHLPPNPPSRLPGPPPHSGGGGSTGIPKPAAYYRVPTGHEGDNMTLGKIAKKYGVSEANLWAYNIMPGVRPSATRAKLLARGPNLIYHNEEIFIPPKNWRPPR